MWACHLLAGLGTGHPGPWRARHRAAPPGHRCLSDGADDGWPLCLLLLAEVLEHAGQVDEGLRVMAEALVAIEASGRYELLAEAYRLQGVLLLQQAGPAPARAEACFHQALTVARRQQAKSWELRAAMARAVAAAGPAEAGRVTGPALPLVHRGLRHRRLAGGQGVAGGTGVIRLSDARPTGRSASASRPGYGAPVCRRVS